MYEQIARNKRRTFLMLFGFVALDHARRDRVRAAVRRRLDRRRDRVRRSRSALAWVSYFNSDKIAIAASRAKPADETEYRRYHNLVEGLCIAAGLPKPRLYVVDDPRRTRSRPAATRSTRRSRSPPACSR